MGFKEDLEKLLNKYSKESGCDTPDFILAEYLEGCLINFDNVVNKRALWYGEKPEQSTDKVLHKPLVSKSLSPIKCERCQKLATHKANLLEENYKLKQRLIDAGLDQPAIRTDIRG
jgi:hypothetical protein